MIQYYSPSGRFSPISFIYLIAVSLITAPILGLIYAYAIWYIPFIYINFLIAAGFGFLIGLAVSILTIEKGKVRNPILGAIMGVFAGFAAMYFHWAIWLDLVINASESYGNDRIGITISNISVLQSLSLAFNPSAMAELMSLVAENGTWGIKGSTVSGTFLQVIWGIEALIVIAIPVLMVYGSAKKPFCEATESWSEEEILNPMEFIVDKENIVNALEKGNYNLFESLNLGNKEQNHSLFTLYATDEVKEYYLMVVNKSPEVNDKGKVTFKEDELVKYISISSSAAETLRRISKGEAVAAN